MSSKIEIQRICQHCGNEYTARTTVTKLCSDKCRKANYKVRQRAEKVQKSNEETKQIKNKPIEEIKAKEFLSVREVSTLLGCSIRTVHRLIENKILNGVNLGERLTRVKRSELNKILEQPNSESFSKEPKTYSIEECYSLQETQIKFNISDGALYNVIKRNKIPKIQKGKFVYVPKELIESLLS